MLNVKSAYTEYGSMRAALWRWAHKAVFRPSIIAHADAPQCALNRRFDNFDNKAVATGANGYRVRWKTD